MTGASPFHCLVEVFHFPSWLFQVVIPVSCIHMVKKQNTALLVPNALSIRTTGGDKVGPLVVW